MRRFAVLTTTAIALAGCKHTEGPSAAPSSGRTVVASVYWQPQRVACGGGRFVPGALTFAHKTLPCGTTARFYHSGRSVTSTLTDRGPYIAGREVDLSDGTARALGLGRSVHRVGMEIVR